MQRSSPCRSVIDTVQATAPAYRAAITGGRAERSALSRNCANAAGQLIGGAGRLQTDAATVHPALPADRLRRREHDDVTEQARTWVSVGSNRISGAGIHALRGGGDRRHIGGMIDANPDKDARADARAAAFQKAVANERNRIHEVPSNQSWFGRLIEAFKRIVGRG